jgi:hypothetical protein
MIAQEQPPLGFAAGTDFSVAAGGRREAEASVTEGSFGTLAAEGVDGESTAGRFAEGVSIGEYAGSLVFA